MIKLTIRQSNGDQFEVQIEKSATVIELKQACVDGCKLDAESQRLIYKGRILKDNDSLESYKIEDGQTIHLVKGKTAAASGTTQSSQPVSQPPPTQQPTQTQPTQPSFNQMPQGIGGQFGFPNMQTGGGLTGMQGMQSQLGNMDFNQMQSMMNSPMVQQLMSDPAFMDMMIQQNPQLRAMCEANPQVRAMLSNPQLLQSMMTPENMAMASQMMQGGGLGGMGAMGGIPNMPMPGGGTTQSTSTSSTAQNSTNPYANMMGNLGGFGNFGGYDPAMMQAMMGGYGAPSDNRPPREKYASQLAQIKEMGFSDEETVLQILVQCNGNVNLAIERLFSYLGQ